jgi:hypothetical protein
MVDKEIIREWVIKAEDDFHFARISLIEKKALLGAHLLSVSTNRRDIPQSLHSRTIMQAFAARYLETPFLTRFT